MFRIVALGLGVWLLTLLVVPPVFGQEGNRAGLVVIHGDGATLSSCVTFQGDTISGYDLLSKSGLDLNVAASGMGATICRLDGEGCTAPAESCFCQCQGGSECLYWSYWQRADDGWRYSNLGAGSNRVTDGAVEGWVWGNGRAQSSAALPDLTFADICPDPTASVALTVTSGATPSPTVVTPPSTPATVSASSQTATTGTTLRLEFLLALLPLSLLVAIFLLRRRKGTT